MHHSESSFLPSDFANSSKFSSKSTPLEGSLSSSVVLSFSESETHSTPTPIHPQLSSPGSPSLPPASDQPMSPSKISSGPRSSLSSQPIRGTPKAADPSFANSKIMASSGSPKSTTAPPKNEGDSGDTPSPTESTTRTSESTHSTPSTTPLVTTSTSSKSPPATSTGGSKAEKPVGGDTDPSTSTTHSTSVVVVHPSNTSTVFTTITSSPESTLSVPSSVLVSINGTVSLTAPPLITVLSTSTQLGGAFVTFTHLVANPGSVDASKQSSGFLENQGQVAGVFTVVGIIASALVVALIWSIRRHRRRQRRKAWFASLRHYPSSPFDDSYRETHEGNYMRSVQTTSEGVHEPYMVNYHDSGYRPRSPPELTEEQTGMGLTGVGTVARGAIVPLRRPVPSGDPFGDPPHAPQNTPVSISPNRDRFAETSGASIAPSSPSIYPESLPPTDDSPSPIESEPKSQLKAFPEPLLRRSLSTPGHANTPPRPPRSHLRDSYKLTDVIPLTPPSSHGHSKDTSPETHFTSLPEPFTPRTWLSVRTRTIPEASASQASRGTFAERR